MGGLARTLRKEHFPPNSRLRRMAQQYRNAQDSLSSNTKYRWPSPVASTGKEVIVEARQLEADPKLSCEPRTVPETPSPANILANM